MLLLALWTATAVEEEPEDEMAATVAVRRWIRGRLASDATITSVVGNRIFHGVAPTGTPFPFIVYQMISPGSHRYAMNGNHGWSDPQFQVKGVSKDSSTDLETIADQIHTLIHHQSGSAQGGTILRCIRTESIDQPDLIDGVRYFNLGGVYRITVQEA